ncbi:MAG: glycosyltransferase [Planctomycetaceae bacterium]|nr:glycosyltransferase [Planctomycetaceae bacterium]
MLHVFGDLGSAGGAEKWFLEMLRLGDFRVRFDFLVNICDEAVLNEVIGLGSAVYFVPFSRSPFPSSCLNPYLNSVRNILRANRYDAIHVHQFDLAGEILRIAAQEHIPKRVMTIHASVYDNTRFHRRLAHYIFGRRWIFKYATDILPCSKLVAETFGLDEITRVKIIHPAVDIERFTIDDARRNELRTKYQTEFNIRKDAVVIGHVGRFTRQKNHKFLVQLLAEMIRGNEKIYAVFIGVGELFEGIRREVIDAGVLGRIILTGKRDDVPAIMGSLFDVLVLPSLYEGLPIVAIEALASGLGVVYSDNVTAELEQFFPTRIFRQKLKINNWLTAIPNAINTKIIPKQAITELINSPFSTRKSLEEIISVYENSQ